MANNQQRPAKLNSRRNRGDTFPWEVTYTAGDAGAPLNLAGWSVELTVVTIPEPPDASTLLFKVNGTITDAANGVVEFPISLTDSDQVPNVYFQDVQGIDGAGKIRTLSEGSWVVDQDRNKDTTP